MVRCVWGKQIPLLQYYGCMLLCFHFHWMLCVLAVVHAGHNTIWIQYNLYALVWIGNFFCAVALRQQPSSFFLFSIGSCFHRCFTSATKISSSFFLVSAVSCFRCCFTPATTIPSSFFPVSIAPNVNWCCLSVVSLHCFLVNILFNFFKLLLQLQKGYSSHLQTTLAACVSVNKLHIYEETIAKKSRSGKEHWSKPLYVLSAADDAFDQDRFAAMDAGWYGHLQEQSVRQSTSTTSTPSQESEQPSMDSLVAHYIFKISSNQILNYLQSRTLKISWS